MLGLLPVPREQSRGTASRTAGRSTARPLMTASPAVRRAPVAGHYAIVAAPVRRQEPDVWSGGPLGRSAPGSGDAPAPPNQDGRLAELQRRQTTSRFTASDVAALLQVPVSWVYAEARAGRIPHVTLGHYRRFRREASRPGWPPPSGGQSGSVRLPLEETPMARRPAGTGNLFVRMDANGRETYYATWYAAGRKVKRRIGATRVPGTRTGLTKTQAEAELRRLMGEVRASVPRQDRISLELAWPALHRPPRDREAAQADDHHRLPHDPAPPPSALHGGPHHRRGRRRADPVLRLGEASRGPLGQDGPQPRRLRPWSVRLRRGARLGGLQPGRPCRPPGGWHEPEHPLPAPRGAGGALPRRARRRPRPNRARALHDRGDGGPAPG